jgi:beta-phosphoglucomutase-like phosphatase (HAD superfamily)
LTIGRWRTLTDGRFQARLAVSGRAHTARPALELLGLAADTPMITRDVVAHAKPDPGLFQAAAALDVEPRHAYVVGDSVWDLLARADELGVRGLPLPR